MEIGQANMNTRTDIKEIEIGESSADKNYWLIIKKDDTSHGEKLTKNELYDLYIKLKEIFKDI